MSDESCDLAHRFGVPYVDIADTHPSPEVLALLPVSVARRCLALPLAVDEGTMTVAMADPHDKTSLELLVQATSLSVFPVVSDAPDISAALDAWERGAIKWPRHRSNGQARGEGQGRSRAGKVAGSRDTARGGQPHRSYRCRHERPK